VFCEFTIENDILLEDNWTVGGPHENHAMSSDCDPVSLRWIGAVRIQI
jgi:hypothetical protein